MKRKKTVVRVQINCDKCRWKAMEVAAKHGADSVAVEGEHGDLLVVRGAADGVDPARLAIDLRKKLGHAEIISVEETREREINADGKGSSFSSSSRPSLYQSSDCRCRCCPHCFSPPPPPPPAAVVVRGDYDDPQPCSIM